MLTDAAPGPSRRLPNFLVIGTLKSGTSSLHHYLRAHPQVFVPRSRKELNFLAYDGVDRGLRVWAKTLEEYSRFFEGSDSAIAVGEVSPAYFASPVAPDRILELVPTARLVLILRQPVDRAYSHYLMSVRQGRIPLDVEKTFAVRTAPHVLRSYYSSDLKRYLERFGRDQIEILLFESLRAGPAETVRKLYGFLGVDSDFVPPLEVWNKGYVPRSQGIERLFRTAPVIALKSVVPKVLKRVGHKVRVLNSEGMPPLSPELRAEMNTWYRDDIREVQDLTGLDLSVWLAKS